MVKCNNRIINFIANVNYNSCFKGNVMYIKYKYKCRYHEHKHV